ncbi:MAG: methyl-accepting chemotaxis protein [Mariniphaga sp.]
MKVRGRFVLSFGFILVFLIGVILVSINQIKASHERLTEIVKTNNVRIHLANQMIDDLRETAIDVRNILLANYQKKPESKVQTNIKELTKHRKNFDLEADSLLKLIPKDETEALEILSDVNTAADSAKHYQDEVIRMAMEGKVYEAAELMTGFAYPAVKQWIKEVSDLIVYNEAYNEQHYIDAEKSQAFTRTILGILGLLAVLCSLVVAFRLTNSITQPLKVATDLIISRDISMDLKGNQYRNDELGQMIQSFRKDISDRIKLEEEMREKSLYARNLIEASLDPLVTISADGKITDVNQTTMKMTGVSREKLVGSDFADYFTEPEKARAGYKLVFSNGIVIDYPLTLKNANGLTTEVLYNATVYRNESGEVQGVFASARDITEIKRQENEMKAYRDQLEVMVKNRTAELTNVLEEVKETINILAASSTQILAATTQVATGTAETATAISETSTTVMEVQQASKQSSQKAKDVADSAQRVVQVFQSGQKAVEETIDGMNNIREQMNSIAQTVVRLSEQSQSIGGIIASVTDIADQSNLLSVNAAIEAAKAGEQGKGFAVVAQEIKNLAGQSKQSTLKVRNILNDIQRITGAAVMATEQGSKAVEAGLKQSIQAGEAIRVLAESSNTAVQSAIQIVASSQQQVVGMDQIGIAIQNINQAGTETAVSMVQAEKSARNLYDLSQKLKAVIEKFQG